MLHDTEQTKLTLGNHHGKPVGTTDAPLNVGYSLLLQSFQSNLRSIFSQKTSYTGV